MIEVFRKKLGVWSVPIEIRNKLHYTEQRELYGLEREEALFRAQERSALATQAWNASGGPKRLRRKRIVIGLLNRQVGVPFC